MSLGVTWIFAIVWSALTAKTALGDSARKNWEERAVPLPHRTCRAVAKTPRTPATAYLHNWCFPIQKVIPTVENDMIVKRVAEAPPKLKLRTVCD